MPIGTANVVVVFNFTPMADLVMDVSPLSAILKVSTSVVMVVVASKPGDAISSSLPIIPLETKDMGLFAYLAVLDFPPPLLSFEACP